MIIARLSSIYAFTYISSILFFYSFVFDSDFSEIAIIILRKLKSQIHFADLIKYLYENIESKLDYANKLI